ncbi:SRPBCC domain-containing protein [Arthrobacter castelli]|uniref:SRPBCC domain-containing protein n=1 Tax=Arthrobacter castelli TaxID=271431 RepID=UPI0004032A0B|nr:SRPBCC domain-containing protein [Arthrobacter castelli]
MSQAPDAFGELTRDGDAVDVRLTMNYDVAAENLWQAITTASHLASWFATVEGELTEGGRCHVVFNEDNPEQRINGTIEECVTAQRLVLGWEMESHPDSTVIAELSDAGSPGSGPGTTLVLEHLRMRDDTAAAYAAGWQAYLEALEGHLAGRTDIKDRWETRWQALLPVYLHSVSELQH